MQGEKGGHFGLYAQKIIWQWCEETNGTNIFTKFSNSNSTTVQAKPHSFPPLLIPVHRWLIQSAEAPKLTKTNSTTRVGSIPPSFYPLPQTPRFILHPTNPGTYYLINLSLSHYIFMCIFVFVHWLLFFGKIQNFYSTNNRYKYQGAFPRNYNIILSSIKTPILTNSPINKSSTNLALK